MKCVDNLYSSINVFVIKNVIRNKNIHTYTLTDDAGNVTELQLEVSRRGHQIKAKIVEMKYNDQTVALPQNSFKIEHVIWNGKVRMLNQYLIIGKTQMHLIYNENGNQTKVIANRTHKNEEGLLIVAIRTDKGKFYYQIRNMR
jgi:hypothetical protein